MSAPDLLDVLVDAGVWATWSTATAWWGSRWSNERVGRDGPLTRLRPKERGGRLYRELGIRRWKRHVPDAGALLGTRSRHLRAAHTRDRSEWESLAAETRRAERVHWLTLAATPVLMATNRGILVPAMLVYGLVANVPCIALQRYNRGRLDSLLAARPTPRPHDGSQGPP